jgi:YD repeat-containing protein
MPRSQSAPRLRLVCLVLVLALFLPGPSLFFPKANASPVAAQEPGIGDPPDKNLPDLEAQQVISPPTPQAADPIPSTLESWSPYDFSPNAPMSPPTVTITSPSEGASFPELTPVTVTATASAPSGISVVSIYANGSLIGGSKNPPYTATWNYFTVGSYTLTAVARAKDGTSATSQPVHITITGGGGTPTVSITSPANGAQFAAPATIQLTAQATAGSGHAMSKVEFFYGATSTLIGTVFGTGPTYQFTWNNVSAGAYSVRAKATDTANLSTTSSAITLNVVAAGPTVSITAPAAGQHIPASTGFQIAATAMANPTRTITQVDFYANNAFIGTDTTAPYSINWSTVQAGSYDLKAVATDNLNANGTSPIITIFIDPLQGNPTVTIQSPSNGQHFTAPASIPITAVPTACCGRSISRVDFYADGSPTPFASDSSSPYNVLFNSSVTGGHTLTAIAIDNQNASGSATITVFIDNAQPPPADTSFSNARLDPLNRTGQPGEDLFSGNINWSLPLVGLAGRAGLDLGLSLTYNSLIWTRDGNAIKFNADNGYPGPGFRLGLPVIQDVFPNAQTSGFSYMMIMPSGYRVDLRKVGSTSLYESADSSYIQFDAASLLARMSDGTQLSFVLKNREYRCTQVKDRNGNFITATYDDVTGNLTTMTDTLGRTLTFVYDALGGLQQITQLWNGVTHNWATFGYTTKIVQTNFSGGLTVIGPANGTPLSVLTQVSLADGSRYVFTYSTYLQVYLITHYAKDGHQLSHTSYNLPPDASVAQPDCPRFTTRADYAERWNGGDEVVTNFTFDAGHSYGQATLPDGTIYKELFATSGYQKGLATQTENWSAGVRKKWTTTTWTQDNTTLTYILNPRPSETNVYDDASNRRRTTVSYQTFLLPSGVTSALPNEVKEYAANATTVLRQTHTDYDVSSNYISTTRRIIGLPTAQYLYEGAGTTLLSKVDYQYDNGSYLFNTPGTPVNHDASYGTSFAAGRGNLWSMRRYDVNFPTDTTKAAQFITGYDTAGNTVLSLDPLAHQTAINYADNFAATATPNVPTTLAYPTAVNDNGFSSSAQYDYDLGAVRQTTDPLSAWNKTTYDAAGRVFRVDVSNGAYTRYVYDDTMTGVSQFSLVDAGLAELFAFQQLDGFGRVMGSASTFPNSQGGYRGTYRYYDKMGRVFQQSNPAEITSNWAPTGEGTAWIWTSQTYDWKGRPRVTTNPDNTTQQISYGGCGCAGGEQVTLIDESNRQQRTTYDVLGRVSKTEVLNWNATVYATTGYTYNGRDQVTRVRQYQGSDTSNTYQDTLMTYDGHGRLQTRKQPIESTACQYTYYADDQLQVKTDPRGATATYVYNARHLMTQITYAKPGNAPELPITDPNAIAPAAQINFDYDAAGNRLWMTDGEGRVDYTYDSLSRLKTEARQFTGVTGTWTLQYDYNLVGELKSLTDAFGQKVDYTYNRAGELDHASIGSFNIVSGVLYRSSGALRQMSLGNGLRETLGYNNRLQVSDYDLRDPNDATYTGFRMTYQYRYDYDGHAAATNDGRVRFARDMGGVPFSTYDRSFGYDHAGRLTTGRSGSDANGQGGFPTGSYDHGYGYDAFDHMTTRGGRNGYAGSGAVPINYSATYTNDRNSVWTYNASGQVITGDQQQYQYDAAGQLHQIINMLIDLRQNGDGQEVRRVVNNLDITYYIRSSALGGQVVNEMSETGGQHRTRIYANGQQVARQKNGNTYWRSVDAGNLTDMESDGSGAVWSRVQLDPLGVVTATGSASPPGGTVNPVGFYGDPSNVSNGCRLDGAPFPCDWLTRIINGGSAVECPDGSCGPRAIRDESGNATGGFEWFRAYADGRAGWLPVTATYIDAGLYTYTDDRYESEGSSKDGVVHLKTTLFQGHLSRLVEVGYQDELRNGDPNPDPEWGEITKITERALRRLQNHPQCNELLSGFYGDAYKTLDELWAKHRIRSSDLPHGPNIIVYGQTFYPLARNLGFAAIGKHTILLDYYQIFHNPNLGREYFGLGLVTSEAQEHNLLHELGHVTGYRDRHSTQAESDAFNRRIAEVCFK